MYNGIATDYLNKISTLSLIAKIYSMAGPITIIHPSFAAVVISFLMWQLVFSCSFIVLYIIGAIVMAGPDLQSAYKVFLNIIFKLLILGDLVLLITKWRLWVFTKITLYSRLLVIRKPLGVIKIITRKYKPEEFYKIEFIEPYLGKYFNYGTIKLIPHDPDEQVFVFEAIPKLHHIIKVIIDVYKIPLSNT